MGENDFSTAAYNQSLSQGKLMGSRCRKCGAVYVPLKPICNKCYKSEMELVEMKGKGRLVAYTIIAVGTPMMIEEGFNREHPYCSGIVELEEGARVPARILGVDVRNPEKFMIGTPVAVEFLKRENKPTIVAFRVCS